MKVHLSQKGTPRGNKAGYRKNRTKQKLNLSANKENTFPVSLDAKLHAPSGSMGHTYL